jgi:hypothetical protein
MAQYEIKKTTEKPFFSWREGKRCAVSLTFDDASLTQIGNHPLSYPYSGNYTFSRENAQEGCDPKTTLLSDLEKWCAYANDPANGIWVDTVEKMASYT